MKQAWILFYLLAALWIVLGGVLLIGTGIADVGFAHAKFADMHQGGDGQARHGDVLSLGWVFGLLEIAVFVTCLALGARRGGKLGAMTVPLFVGGILMASVFSGLLWAYRSFLSASEPAFLGPFPAPTALLVIGMWAAPLVFVVLYVVAFDRWIVTNEDLAALEKLVAENRRRKESNP